MGVSLFLLFTFGRSSVQNSWFCLHGAAVPRMCKWLHNWKNIYITGTILNAGGLPRHSGQKCSLKWETICVCALASVVSLSSLEDNFALYPWFLPTTEDTSTLMRTAHYPSVIYLECACLFTPDWIVCERIFIDFAFKWSTLMCSWFSSV